MKTHTYWGGDQPGAVCRHDGCARPFVDHVPPMTEVSFSPHPNEHHRFVNRCVVCGKEGTLVISLITEDEKVRTEAR